MVLLPLLLESILSVGLAKYFVIKITVVNCDTLLYQNHLFMPNKTEGGQASKLEVLGSDISN